MQYYPQYPLPKNSPMPKGQLPKDSVADIMATWDWMTSIGLEVIPKQIDKKLPAWEYWKKDSSVEVTRQNVAKSQKLSNVSGWCVRCGEASGRLVVVDLDTAELQKNGHHPSTLYDRIQMMSETGFVLRTPANGVHMYYRIPEGKEILGNHAPPVKGLDIRGEGGQVVSLHGYNRYEDTPEKQYATHKGVVDGHTAPYEKLPFGTYNKIPLMEDELYEWLNQGRPEKRPKTIDHVKGENYGKTEAGSKRVENHFKQPPTERERIVMECLTVILKNWNPYKSYDNWLQLWMSAHHGSEGSVYVRDLILEHDNVYWSDGLNGHRHFKLAWDEHEHNEEGFTVASLFYLARQEGWLASTGYELTANVGEAINVRYVSEWLDTQLDIPRRVLLKSQTGSGKTYNIGQLWERLGRPKSVVFVPTIKLATELAYTLANEHNIPATLYLDDTTQRIKDLDVLASAEFLVTTLQTFGTKVYPHVDMKSYGLVYVEEADQLVMQFARGGGGVHSTHVSDHEARQGFKVLRGAMRDSGCVWFVDATMTKVTYYLAEALKAGNPLSVVVNEFVSPKPKVAYYSDKGSVYHKILSTLEQGDKVVVASDTKSGAREVFEVMQQLGYTNSILITADTKHQNDVRDFMRDVNAGAEQYQLVCYSPVMASGVSITSVRPKLVAQFSRWLTPRNNLQMLNRYRKQDEVICVYSESENLYGKPAQEVMDEAELRAFLESENVRIPLAIRNSDAELRSRVASMAIGDESLQMRAPKEFYTHLLAKDGRAIEWVESEIPSATIKHTLKGVREARKEQKKLIAKTWREVEPIDRDNPASPDMSSLDVARGEVHAYIKRCLFGNIPDDVENEYIYEVVNQLGSYGYHLDAFIRQEHTVERAEYYLADEGKALVSLANNVTMIKVVSLVRHLYDSLDATLEQDTVEARARFFLDKVRMMREEYDSVIPRKRQRYDAVRDRGLDTEGELALAFSKIMLARIGLKQRATRVSQVDGEAQYGYHIENADKVAEFLNWRNEEETDIVFSDEKVQTIIDERKDENDLFGTMSKSEQSEVFDKMRKNGVTFKQAVNIVHNKDEYNGF